jgi:hypothetical protein
MFEGQVWIVIAAAVGCAVLWSKEGPTKLRVDALSNVVDRLPFAENVRYFVQFFVFVLIGTFASLLMIAPTTARQAFAAGLGCTAALTKTAKK